MALLTAEDVLTKEFLQTKFREGYDMDEVDEYLDEVGATIRDLSAENEELKGQLEAAKRRIAELEAGGAATTGSQPVVAEAPVQAPAQAAGDSEPESATQLIALAQRVHDEYVRNGREESERIVAEARGESERIGRETQEERTRTLTQLENERGALERKIDELRVFERDYRGRLKGYLESLLGNLDANHEGQPSADGGF